MTTKTVEVTGLLGKEKVFNILDKINIHDVSNGVNAEVTFDCKKENRNGYFSSFVKSEKTNENGDHENRTDLIEIKLTDDADFEIGKGSGSYLEKIEFDGREFWNINDGDKISKWTACPPADILKSDSSRRADLIAITKEQWEEAENAKIELEEA